MEGMFANGLFNQDLPWDTSNVKNMKEMFASASVFNGDVTAWDTSKVTSMYIMFYGATAFAQDISCWDASQVTDMNYMFHGSPLASDCTFAVPLMCRWGANQVFAYNAVGMDGSCGTTCPYTALTDSTIHTARDTWMAGSVDATYGPIELWDVTQVTSFPDLFSAAAGGIAAGAAVNAKTADLSCWDTSNVENLVRTFKLNTAASSYGIENWNTASVKLFVQAFDGAVVPAAVEAFSTSAATHLDFMFRDTSFNGDLSAWDVSKVVSVNGLFYSSEFNNPSIASWDVSAVASSVDLFRSSLFGQDVSSSWNLASLGAFGAQHMFRDSGVVDCAVQNDYMCALGFNAAILGFVGCGSDCTA
jgi:surface protein